MAAFGPITFATNEGGADARLILLFRTVVLEEFAQRKRANFPGRECGRPEGSAQ